MREILFRGKRKDNGEWVYGDLWSMPNNGFAIVNDGNQWCESKDFNPINVDPETVGQFTGLYDKHNKPIYEGDIIKIYDEYHHDYFTFKVIWNKLKLKWHGVTLDDTEGKSFIWDDPYLTFEVIGNIYDNPSLAGENK